ncbi:MAG: pyridoxal-phosphate dependent enzyme [Nanoarchaeota archaeon]|nr:MAG: pyridoxal-phosphate dependent enzyme [Nanoarchaeota archaeon]
MARIFQNTNVPKEVVDFETALMAGLGSEYGLYTVPKNKIPLLSADQIAGLSGKAYSQIAFEVLNPFIGDEIPRHDLIPLLRKAYPDEMKPVLEHVIGEAYLMWLTEGSTYSFKDYAARFFGQTLDYFLRKSRDRRLVLTATSGDTGGAIADALFGLESVDVVVFYPRGAVTEEQRRQMTTLGGNVHAFDVEGDFDVCQALAKQLMGDKLFAKIAFGDENRLTSANSISLGRMLPQIVFPFYAYSQVGQLKTESASALGYESLLHTQNMPMVVSIPGGNLGSLMGTIIAKAMGAPISRILCGVNENTEFPEFLRTDEYAIRPTQHCPSSAQDVSHASNLARIIFHYGGHMYDEREPVTREVIRPGVITRMPNMQLMNDEIFSRGVSNEQHYGTMNSMYQNHEIVLDPHGATAWRVLEDYIDEHYEGDFSSVVSVSYETADPGKFPNEVKHALGFAPDVPKGIQEQAKLPERVHRIESRPYQSVSGVYRLSPEQFSEAKERIAELIAA